MDLTNAGRILLDSLCKIPVETEAKTSFYHFIMALGQDVVTDLVVVLYAQYVFDLHALERDLATTTSIMKSLDNYCENADSENKLVCQIRAWQKKNE